VVSVYKQTCSHTAQQFKVLVFAVLLQLAFQLLNDY
jgi:hypothetical protein